MCYRRPHLDVLLLTKKILNLCSGFFNGGEAEIRTLGGLAPSTVFKTAALNHSATSPKSNIHHARYEEIFTQFCKKVKNFFQSFEFFLQENENY